MSDLILTREELRDLTGYQRPSKQIAKLRDHGIRHIIAADGHPRVLRSELESKQTKPRRAPNFEALPACNRRQT